MRAGAELYEACLKMEMTNGHLLAFSFRATVNNVALPPPEPTPEERLDTLETTTDDIILMMADIIGGE